MKKRNLLPDAKLKGLDYAGYFFGAGTNNSGYIVSAFLLIYYSKEERDKRDAGKRTISFL